MRTARNLGIALLVLVAPRLAALALQPSEDRAIDEASAKRYFEEAREFSLRDGGRLWGVELHGPMLFADPATRQVVANQADKQGRLQERDGVFVGSLPADQNVANTAVTWAGIHWTMVVWPLPEDRRDRLRLMMHEMWHRVQDRIGLPAGNPANAHLDSRDGRVWLQLEWRALAAALGAADAERRTSVEDALVFRAHRRSLFPKAAEEERALEMNEGLAEYTGIRLSAGSRAEAIDSAVQALRGAHQADTFIRSFAYASGPAYGLLLDEAGTDWRAGLKPDHDLGDMLGAALAIERGARGAADATSRLGRYQAEDLLKAEDHREAQRQVKRVELRRRFVEGPVVVIPLRMMNVQFNPNNLQPLDDLGTVYPTGRISDVWGILSVSGGMLLSPNWNSVRVPAPAAPEGHPLAGDGWTLELNEGWTLEPGERPGDYRVALKPAGD